jgi:hypothetical protein
MTELQSALREHEFAWIDVGRCNKRDTPFFYSDIGGKHPGHRISVISAGLPDRPDWYFRIYEGNRKVCEDRHFRSAEDALAAAWTILNEADATKLRLRKIERWLGDNASTVDGLLSADVIVAEIKPSQWWFQVVEDAFRRTPWTGPWTSDEEAFLAVRECFRFA